MSKSIVSPTASDVRAFLNADPKRLASLPAEAQKTVAPGARGRLHAKAIARFNKGRKPENQYVLGIGLRQKAEREALRADLVSKGLAGTRGPLSKAVKASLSTPKG